MNTLLVIVIGVLVLTVLVVVHEFGHFIAARAFGVRVTEFMVGLPGPSVGFNRKGTRYGVSAVLLGGYARVCGMATGPEDPLLAEALAYVNRHGHTDVQHLALGLDIDEDYAETLLVSLSEWGSITTPKGKLTGSEYLACERDGYAKGQPREVPDPAALLDEERKGTYRSLPVWKRLVILFAGPVANLVFALIIFVALFSGHGVYVPSNIIYDVVDGAPAQVAGLEGGDRIVGIDDVEVVDWDSFVAAMDNHEPGDVIAVTYERDGQEYTTDVELYENESGSVAMGVYADYEIVHYTIFESCKETFSYFGQVCVAVAQLFWPTTAQQTLDNSVSIVGIAYEAKAAADMSLLSLFALAGAVSISLGIFNLLPIPPLDGGKIVVEVVQKAIRRELPQKIVSTITVIGIVLFLALFAYLLFKDIGTYVIGG